MSVRVQAVRPELDEGLRAFQEVARRVYAGDRNYIPTPEAALRAELLREPFTSTQHVLVADTAGEPAARAVARTSPTLGLGMIGFFEAINDRDTAGALLAEAVARLRADGAERIIGPIDGDTWHHYRFTTGPIDEPPFLMEPYNPPFYPELWQAAGFRPLESYYSKRVDEPAALADRLERVAQRVRDNGYSLRPLDRAQFHRELEIIHRISCRIFADNFLYTGIPLEDFLALYAGARALIDPDLVWFGHAPDGEPVGFAFALPDCFRAVAAMRGKRSLPARLRFLLHRRGVTTLNVKTIGVVDEHRRSGLGAALLHQVYRVALDKGFRTANHCLIKDGNPSGDMDRGLGRIFRRYTLYESAP